MPGYYGCLLAMLPIIFSYAKAQEPYSLVHYDESTLPQTSIGNIQQDEWGYLWMNTQFGIVRFDGEKIRVFTTSNLKGLTSNRIRLCAKGLDNAVYFVDENNVIVKVKSPNRFETRTTADCIKEWRLPLYSRESNNEFAYLNFDKRTGYKQLVDSLKNALTREFLKVYPTGEKEGYLFYVDQEQKVRLCYYNGKNYHLQVQSDSFKAQHTFKLNNFVFSQTGPSEAWLFQKRGKEQKVQVSGLPSEFAHALKEESPILFSSASGTFFYASGKLYQYSIKDGSITATLMFKDLPCNGVVNVMQERTTGDFLISTKSTGFYRIKKKRFSTINLTGPSGETSGANTDFNNNIIYALAPWDRQHIFCTGYITPVEGAGVSRKFDAGNKARFNHYFLYPKDSVHVWLNFDDGIQSFNKQTGRYTPLLKILEPRKVIELSDGTSIIVAARTIVALRNNTARELYRNDTIDFTTAEKVSEDCLAVGTANGLYYFYPSQKKLQAVPYKTVLKVRFLFKDKRDRLWFTTYGQGLFYLSGHSIIPLPVDHAGYLAIGHSIVEDNKSHFWISTNHGLFRLDYASLLSIIRGQSTKLYYSYFDKTDGFNTNEFNGGCSPSSVYQEETGQLFFPSMDGIVRFHPDSITSATGNSPVFLDEIVVNDTGRVEAASGRPVFPKQSSSLRVDFSSPYYGHAENIKFAYTLSDAPEQWKDLQSSRSIFLNNLPGGSYTLTIKKEGAASTPIIATFNFEIEKKFSETLFFKLLILAVVIALVYFYFKARLYYLHKERNRLEQEVAVKTADQLKLIDQLKYSIAQMEQLQLEREQMIGHKENIIAVLIHDIKSPLYFLNTVASYLNKNIDQNPPDKNKEITEEIATSLSQLYLFTQDFAIWLNASQPGHIQNGEKIELEKIIADALAVYKQIIDKKGILIRHEIASGFVYGDEPMIKSVIRNLVDNAVKNTTHGSITLSASYLPDKQGCEINIADEGKGMSEEQMTTLNQYFQFGEKVLPSSTSGFGHKVIKDFLSKMEGTIEYRHNHPSGVVVTINLPVINLLQQNAL
ncbi:MAG: ATP-binding protein [Chitinophagaceae bacterium]